MNFRKLRIAWSVFCGLLCVLLIALWLRSYWRVDVIGVTGPKSEISISTCTGFINVWGSPKLFQWRGERFEYVSRRTPVPDPNGAISSWRPFFEHAPTSGDMLSIPIWMSFVPLIILAVLPFHPWFQLRFSLRTLLIAITAVSVALALIVGLSRR